MINPNMNRYEKEQFEAIQKWKKTEPSVIAKATSKAANVVLEPLSKVTNKKIPTRFIQGCLTCTDWLAQGLTDTKDIKRDGGVQDIYELRHKDLKLSDKLANDVHNWAKGIAVGEGLLTGATGLPGLLADIPALITMCLRVIHKIGLCYGYTCKTQRDKQLVFSIMSVAGANDVKEKTIALANLQAIKVMIANNTWKKIAEKASKNQLSHEALVTTIKRLAKLLGINLTKRKARQAIPVIGAFSGAAMNMSLVDDVAWAARRTFQEMWLQENGLIVEAEYEQL